MENLDTKLMAHVGAEILVVGGVAFYLNKQTSALRERVEQLEKQNAKLMEIVDVHERCIRELLGNPPQKSVSRVSPAVQKPVATKKAVRASPKKQKPPPPEEESEPEFDPAELDEELSEELGELIDEEEA